MPLQYLTLDRINKHIPGAKLIVILRNPIDRAVSCYFHLIRHGFVRVCPLNEGMKEILELEQGNLGGYRRVIEYGLYAEALKRYFDLFDRSNFFIRLHEDVHRNPDKTMEDVFSFLGVDSCYRPKSINQRANEGVYSLERLKFLAKGNRYNNFDESNERVYPPKDIAPWLMTKLVAGIDKFVLANFSKSEKPKLNIEIRKQLYSYYEKDRDYSNMCFGKLHYNAQSKIIGGYDHDVLCCGIICF